MTQLAGLPQQDEPRQFLRPGFSLEVLAEATAREALTEHLAWFYQQAVNQES
ncbi:hypothetical protein [Micromonospora endophytica]|uniref:hypothetical protein n=1 Tax=Micromonospora endophytica TaxID=515350 RepID=UPI0015E8C695|nr:hypothetical protein [Micromonospora endophytica]BCJ62765.1 hypothetical protein Jiend_61870 [Micromonospora endophytica]